MDASQSFGWHKRSSSQRATHLLQRVQLLQRLPLLLLLLLVRVHGVFPRHLAWLGRSSSSQPEAVDDDESLSRSGVGYGYSDDRSLEPRLWRPGLPHRSIEPRGIG